MILELLGSDSALRSSKVMTKEKWTEILRASGLDDDGMHRWHIEFEKKSPNLHADFLRSLGISEKEVTKIKQWSTS